MASKSRRNLLSLILVAAIHGMVHTLSTFLSPLNAEIAQYFHLESITGVTAFKTTYLLVYAASNLFFGVLTNRISVRLTLGLGIILNGAAVAAFRFVPPDGIVFMHLLWTLCAIGGGVYHPVANVFVTRLYPARKGWALGITGVGANTGFAFAPFLTGFLSSFLLLSWRDISLVFGGLALAGGVMGLVWVRDIREPALPACVPEPAAAGDSAVETGKQSGPRGITLPLFVFLVFIILIAGIRDTGMWTILDISDFFITGIHGSPVRTAWALFCMYFPAIFIQPVIGSLSDKIGRKTLSVISLAGYGISVAMTALIPGGIILVPYILMGFLQSPSTPLMEALVADYTTPRTRGIVFGIYIAAIMGMSALGPLFGGIFLDAFGKTADSFRALLLGMGFLIVLGSIAMIFSGRVSRALGIKPASSSGG